MRLLFLRSQFEVRKTSSFPFKERRKGGSPNVAIGGFATLLLAEARLIPQNASELSLNEWKKEIFHAPA